MRTSPVSVTFDGVPLAQPIIRLEMTAAFNAHTVAVLDISVTSAAPSSASASVLPEFTPVVVTFNDGVNAAPWYGYVHHGGMVADIRQATGTLLRYTLIGTSLPMNQQTTRAWKKTSASAIVRQIAREHRLRSVITPTRSPIDYYAQTGVSDWKVLQEMATRTGYRLWVDGSTVSFVSASILLKTVRAMDVPIFSQNRTPGMPDTLVEFTSKVGTMVPRRSGNTAKQIVYGLDLRSGRVVKASSTNALGSPSQTVPTRLNINTGVRVGSVAQAQSIADAQSANTQGWVTAEAVVKGDPSLRPGSIISITGNAVPADQRGLWLVTKAVQRVLYDDSNPMYPYMTILSLERDRYYSPTFSRSFQTTNTADNVDVAIRNGIFWESNLMEEISVG